MAKLTEEAKGVYVIAVTPFTDNGALDLDSVDSMVDFYEDAGVTGLTYWASWARRRNQPQKAGIVVDRVLMRLGGRLPVVVALAPGLAPMRELAEAVMSQAPPASWSPPYHED